MYALMLVRYRRPLPEIETATEAHRAYLRTLKEQGLLLASGPMDPRTGGMFLLRVQDANPLADLDTIRNNDPFFKAGLATYEPLVWNVVMGKEGLDQL
jgi:uncharacterized protein YciI